MISKEIKSKLSASLFIIAVTIILRLFKLGDLMLFGQDPAWYFLQAKDFIQTGVVPLVGIPTSVPVLRQGAIWTWFLAIALKVGNYTPVWGGYTTALFGVLSIIFIQNIVSRWHGKRLGYMAAFIAATLPFLVITDRTPYVLSPAITAILATAYYFDKSCELGGKYYFVFGLLLSVTLQFLLGSFIVFPIFLATIAVRRVKLSKRDVINFFAGSFTGILPFFIFDVTRGVFIQTVGFFVWFFTKPFEFIFLEGTRAGVGVSDLVNHAVGLIVFPQSLLIGIMVLGLGVYVFLKNKFIKEKVIERENVLVTVWLIVSLSSYAIRGTYSYAFLPTIVFPVIVVLAILFDNFIKRNKLLGYACFALYLTTNVVYLFVNDFRFSHFKPMTLGSVYEVVDYIAADSQGKRVNYVYAGRGREFPSRGDNFDYLFLLEGITSDLDSDNKYIIFDEDTKLKYDFKKVKDLGYYRVGKVND